MPWLTIIIFISGLIVTVFLILRIASQVNQQLAFINQQVNERLKETAQALLDTHKTVGERLDSATKVFGAVQKSLGRLEETQRHIYEISKDISSLQDLLRAPKFRGEMGETLLGKLLEDILPKENIRLQYRFKNGDTADAVKKYNDARVKLGNFNDRLSMTAQAKQITHV